jgi:hypothetical protein
MNNKNYKRKRKEKKSTRKYVGGAAAQPAQIHDVCSILQTEINHDFKFHKHIIRDPLFNLQVARNLSGACQMSVASTNPIPFMEDHDFVAAITGAHPPDLKVTTENYRNILCQKRQSDTSYLQGHQSTRFIFKHKKKNLDTGEEKFENELFNLFSNNLTADENGWIDIFFVIDTGDNLVKLLKGLKPPGGKKYRFHIIHSVYTLGDSAPKSPPNSLKYRCRNPEVQLYSWLFTDNPPINSRDPIFMTSYNINCTVLHRWKVYQIWKDGEQLIWQTWDSKDDHTAPQAKKEIEKRGDIYDRNNNIDIQKKRSGDYFQIRFAKKFPRYMANRRNLDLQVYNRTGYDTTSLIDDQSKFHTLFANDHQAEYRKRTFFVTGDWPAFSYSLFNRVNSIIFAKHPDINQLGFLSASIHT